MRHILSMVLQLLCFATIMGLCGFSLWRDFLRFRNMWREIKEYRDSDQ